MIRDWSGFWERVLISVTAGIATGVVLYYVLPSVIASATVAELRKLGMVAVPVQEVSDYTGATTFREEI